MSKCHFASKTRVLIHDKFENNEYNINILFIFFFLDMHKTTLENFHIFLNIITIHIFNYDLVFTNNIPVPILCY